MQQFKALLLKEFYGYFRSIAAYLVIFTYLFSSIGTAFYFGSYLGMHDTALYALFFAQPVILTIFVPTVTMRLWAEEYRSGTAEFLLTQPLSILQLVLSKFLVSWLFFIVCSLLLLPFVFYTYSWLHLDLGNIFLCFLGVWFVSALYCALGNLLSSLTSNSITAYLSGFFILGLSVTIPKTFLYFRYADFLFAEIGLTNILYFVSFSGLFLLLNLMVLKFRTDNSRHKKIQFLTFSFLLLLLNILLNVAISNLFASKIDLTASHFYTPKSQTTTLLKDLNTPININVYASKDYINSNIDYFYYLQQIKRFLERYQTVSQGMINVNITQVEAFSALEENVLNKGLYFETNAKGSRDYLGAVISNSDGSEEVIKQFLLQRRIYLEKDLDSAIIRLLHPEMRKTIGVYMDGLQNLEGFQSLLLWLENDYNVFTLTPSMYDISSQVSAVLLINPKNISQALRYALDQYLLNGGSIIVFFDFYTASQSETVNNEDVKIIDFLDNWQIKLNPQMVDDGNLNKDFFSYFLKLRLNKAAPFEIHNPAVNVTPVIISENSLLGAIINGKFSSLYTENPFAKTSIAPQMKPFLKQSAHLGRVAVFSDVDMLEDAFWIDEKSPDKNPFSVIEKSGNGAMFRKVVNTVVGNDVYESLPVNVFQQNTESLSQRLNALNFSKIEAAYKALQNKILEQRRTLYQISGEDLYQMEQIMQITEAGRTLALDEKKLQSLEYKLKDTYSHQIFLMMFQQILLYPLLLSLLIFALAKSVAMLINRRLRRKYNV